MTTQRDDFSNATKEILAKRAGQICSNPECRRATSGPHVEEDKAVNVGVAAHISAAAPGGPRFKHDISREDRSAIANGIWLCQTCAKLVDSDIRSYPLELLIIWKRRHEEFVK